MLDTHTVKKVLSLHNSNQSLRLADVEDLLSGVRGTTFARLVSVTKVPTAAENKHRLVQKVTVSNVQLFNNITDFNSVYENAVKRSAAKIADNEQSAIDKFQSQGNYFEHTDCFSIVKHKTQDKYYLFAIYNGAESEYFIDGKATTKLVVSGLLTPSAANKILAVDNTVRNVTFDVVHDVTVRTISLDSIVSISTKGTTLTI